MTNPVILLGTQSNGETLPVQVDATGRLVAEGLQGPPGPPGPPGPQGPEGEIELPPNPSEGSLLGWSDGELAWSDGGQSGLPLPLGPEGSILTIVNGEPTWSAPGQFCVYPDPRITLSDGIETNNFGVFDDFGNRVTVSPWNGYAQTLYQWKLNPDADNFSGIVQSKSKAADFTFNLNNATGMVLTLVSNSKRNSTNSERHDYTTTSSFVDDSHLVPLGDTGGAKSNSKGNVYWKNQHSWFLNRESYQDIQLRLRVNEPPNAGDSSTIQISLKYWELTTVASYLRTRAEELQTELADEKARFLSIVDPTTDIDLSRLS